MVIVGKECYDIRTIAGLLRQPPNNLDLSTYDGVRQLEDFAEYYEIEIPYTRKAIPLNRIRNRLLEIMKTETWMEISPPVA